MAKCKLKQCKCKKTFSAHDGDLEKGMCFTCLEKETESQEKTRLIKEGIANRKKAKKPKKIEKDMEKLAGLVE